MFITGYKTRLTITTKMKTVISEMSTTGNNNNVQPSTSSNTDSSKARRRTTRSRSCSDAAFFFDGGKSRSSASVSPGGFSQTMSCTDIDSIRLPADWEMDYTDDGELYFFRSDSRTTTWNDPRKMANEKEEIYKSFCQLRIKIQSVLRESLLQGVINGRKIIILLDTAIKSWLTHTNCPPVEIIGYVSPQLENSLKVDVLIGREDLPKILKPETLDSSGSAFFETIYGRVYYSEETIAQTTEDVINWRTVKTRNVRRSLSCTDLDTVADLLPENWRIHFDGNNNPYFANQHNSEEWSWEAPRTATAQLKESFKTAKAMKRSESTGNLFGCTSRSQSALVIRIHSTTNDCSILGHSCYDDRTLKIYLDTGSQITFISRSRTPPSAIFKVPDTLSLLGSGKHVYTNEMAKLILTHQYSPPVEVFAYVLDDLPIGDILFGPDNIAQILKPEALDNGRAYLDTIYGRVFYSDERPIENYYLYYHKLHFEKQINKTA